MRIVTILAFVGLGISGYLLVLKLTGSITSIQGCGGDGGCENVLGSKWSQWFGIPVSAFSTLLYGSLIALTFQKSPSRKVVTGIAALLICAAVWFIGLQIFVIKSFCLWCCATHAVGLITAIFLLRTNPKDHKYSTGPATMAGIALFLVLVAGQLFGPEPDTHEVTEDQSFVGSGQTPVESQNPEAPENDRIISFQNGNKVFRVSEFPLIGSPDATHILVKYFDYTCASCRDAEGDLTRLLGKYPEDVAFIVLPTPLNKKCNPYLKPGMPDHDHACELARLGLAAWKAAPDQFEDAHHLLFERPVVGFAAAREKLIKIIPAADLDAALADPWIERTLKTNFEDFRALTHKSPVMPKLLIAENKLFQGVAKSTDVFIREMEKILKLQ